MFAKGVIVIQVVIMFIFDEILGKYRIRKKSFSCKHFILAIDKWLFIVAFNMDRFLLKDIYETVWFIKYAGKMNSCDQSNEP